MVGERIIVGCRDGSIIELNAGQKKTVMESHSDGEVWGLAVSTESPNIIVSAGDDNKLKVWDVS
jgi:WD40 repeat protein